MTAPRACVILLSGGLDSATTLAIARRDGFRPHALTIDYGQRHRIELAAATAVAQSFGVIDHRLIKLDLRALGGSALTADIPVPKDRPLHHVDRHAESREGEGADASADTHPDTQAAIPITYVPARNLIFLSIAAAYAETIDARDLFLGVNQVDWSGYPDCREEFLAAFALAANAGTRAGASGHPFTIHAPLSRLGKPDIIRLGASLGVDYSLTFSCYDPIDGLACGHCDSCLIRAKGFADAGIPDPTRYNGTCSPPDRSVLGTPPLRGGLGSAPSSESPGSRNLGSGGTGVPPVQSTTDAASRAKTSS
ncbi:MAG: 7-cyano-7-deazaguanine synthase QueC [Phycisphaerales bacterium]